MATEKLIRASDARRAILKEDPKLAYCIDDIPGVDAVEKLQAELEDVKCCLNIARNDYRSVRERNRELQTENERLRKENDYGTVQRRIQGRLQKYFL